jgi:hypothetical protein
MRSNLTLAIFAFSLVLTFECPALLAQTEDARPVLRASDLDIHTCDPFKNPVPGESLADAARRIKAGKNCTDKVKAGVNLLRERIWKKADLDNGFVKVAATAEVSTPSFLIARANVYVQNTSPIRQAYTLTVRCGEWSKTVSGSVDASDASQTGQGFGKPAFSLDVSPPCKVFESSLELSSPDEVKRKPEGMSASTVPGVSDEEMAQRLKSIQGVTQRETASFTTQLKNEADAAAFSARIKDMQIKDTQLHDIIENCYRIFDVYQGRVYVAVKPPAYAVENSTGRIRRLEVMVGNESPEMHRLTFRLSCGSWRQEEHVSIGPMTTYDFGDITPMGEPMLVYRPPSDCTIYNLGLDMWRVDVQ